MKSKKILALIMALALILVSFAACSNTADKEPVSDGPSTVDATADDATAASENAVNVSFLKGPTGMGAAYLWTQSDEGKTSNSYNITLDTDATVVGPKLMQGEYDIASIPTNLAATLYQKSAGKVKVIAVNTLGVLYLLSKDNAVTSLADLKGKTITASGQGTVAEYALDYVLENAGLNVGTDVNIEFTTEHSETVTKAVAGECDVVLLPEPFVSQLMTKDASFTIAVDITDEWEKSGDATLTMGCIAVNSAYYDTHKTEVDAFLTDYSASVEYVNNNIADAAALIESHDIMPAAVATKAIPNSNIVCYTGEEMITALSSCLKVFFEQNAASIGGKMPADDFYISIEG